MKYVIKNYDKPGFMIAGIGIGVCSVPEPVVWTQIESEALLLEEGEALAAIAFIGDAIDWELAEELYADQQTEI